MTEASTSITYLESKHNMTNDNGTYVSINNETTSTEENIEIIEIKHRLRGRPRGTIRARIEARKHLCWKEDNANQRSS